MRSAGGGQLALSGRATEVAVQPVILPRVRSAALAAVVVALALPATSAQAAFPGNNGAIAWSHPTGITTDSEIFIMLPDGSSKRKLTDNGQNDFNPAWSPTGRAIAYESSSQTDVDIWILDRRGERNITNDPGHANRYPAWSPDGSQIAFSRQTPFTADGPLSVIDVDGTNPRQITASDSVNDQPSWSPDGQLIAFVSDRGGDHDIWAIRPDGTGLTQITDTPNLQEANPNWSPDGARIAYDVCQSATFPCAGSTPNYEIVTADPDGGNVKRLTNVAGIDAHPAWSPDGTQIVFRSDRTGWTQIWKMNADGTGVTQLTFKNFQGGVDPDWQPLP